MEYYGRTRNIKKKINGWILSAKKIQELIQKIKDEMAEAQVNFRKQIADRDEKIAELQKRIDLKDAYQARMEENIKEKYQKYIDNYESIGKLVFDAQLKADSMEKGTKEKCDQMIAEAGKKKQNGEWNPYSLRLMIS